jgi:hypothetical protein
VHGHDGRRTGGGAHPCKWATPSVETGRGRRRPTRLDGGRPGRRHDGLTWRPGGRAQALAASPGLRDGAIATSTSRAPARRWNPQGPARSPGVVNAARRVLRRAGRSNVPRLSEGRGRLVEKAARLCSRRRMRKPAPSRAALLSVVQCWSLLRFRRDARIRLVPAAWGPSGNRTEPPTACPNAQSSDGTRAVRVHRRQGHICRPAAESVRTAGRPAGQR